MPVSSFLSWKIFFCHSGSGKSVVRELEQELPRWLTVWLDENELIAGENFSLGIEEAIRHDVRYVVFFCSGKAVQSKWVEKELSWALEKEQELGREIVIPVLMDDLATWPESRITKYFENRLILQLVDQKKKSVQALGRDLIEHITKLLFRDLQMLESLYTNPLRGDAEGNQQTARFWHRRSEFSSQNWKDLFASARNRIWLLGHSMTPAVDPHASGSELTQRLVAGVDLRLVVLDPVSTSNYQLHDIERQIDDPDLRGKIVRTLRFAETIEKSASGKRKTGELPARFSVGVTEDVMHNSIVIVDNRFLITIYSHLDEMGDAGITMDLNVQRETENDLCKFFEKEFLRTWRNSRPILDYQHQPLRVESRVYGHREKVREISSWYDDATKVLPPPHLAVIYPTYRCIFGPRSGHVESALEVPEGPYRDKLLCSNCMFGPILNRGGMTEMPADSLARLCDDLIENGVNQIEIAGGGEPLHHRQASSLIDVIHSKQLANSGSVKFGLLSNVAALSNCDLIDKLLGSFAYIRWSWPESVELSSTLAQSYVKDLYYAVERKKELQGQGRLANDVRIGVKVLATKENVAGDHPSLVTLVNELVRIGIDHIKIRPIRSCTTHADSVNLRKAEDALLRLELDLIRKGSLSGNKTLEVDLRERYVKARYKCRLSSLTAVIEPNGSLRICWNDVAPNEDRVIGNVFSKTFSELWGSTRHHEICHATKADWICNAIDGCHCRIVGYQDAAEKLLLGPTTLSTADEAIIDGFV